VAIRAGGGAAVRDGFVERSALTWLTGRLLLALIAGWLALGVWPVHAEPLASRHVALLGHDSQVEDPATRWRRFVSASQGLAEQDQLRLVNDFFNFNLQFGSDPEVWGRADYWATPLEALGRGMGDCEDYTVGKYVTLGLLGVPLERLRITYVRAETGFAGERVAQAHMVLAYYPAPDADPLILDNLVGRVLPASRRPDLQPVFGFNSEHLWIAGVKAAADPTARLSRWRDLLQRLGRESIR
jgi:predicted transglutaminase-like cysteine proteinase